MASFQRRTPKGNGKSVKIRSGEDAKKDEEGAEKEELKLAPSTVALTKIQKMSEALVFHDSQNAKVKYQLKYLNLRARAEPIRMLLHYVRQPYDEQRDNFEKFARQNSGFPQTRLPKLVVLGKMEIYYTNVILQYLGRKYGLQPESSEEKAVAEMLGQRLQEYLEFLRPYVNCLLGFAPAERLPDLREDVLRQCVLKDYGPTFDAQLQKNKTGYLVGESLTWIDFYAAAFADLIYTYGDGEFLDFFPRILKHRKAVLSLPQLEDYLRKRPKTLF